MTYGLMLDPTLLQGREGWKASSTKVGDRYGRTATRLTVSGMIGS